MIAGRVILKERCLGKSGRVTTASIAIIAESFEVFTVEKTFLATLEVYPTHQLLRQPVIVLIRLTLELLGH